MSSHYNCFSQQCMHTYGTLVLFTGFRQGSLYDSSHSFAVVTRQRSITRSKVQVFCWINLCKILEIANSMLLGLSCRLADVATLNIIALVFAK